MKSCLLKSFPNGIAVHLPVELDFADVIREVALKFKESGDFFKNAKLAISFEGRELTTEEEEILLDTIQANSHIQITCLVSKDGEKNRSYLNAISSLAGQLENKNHCQLYEGNVKDGQVIETKRTLVILGDVEKGCAVVSNHDIIITGILKGEAHAGAEGDSSCYVYAGAMDFERLKIGNIRFRPRNEKKSFWPVKQKTEPKLAVIENETVVIKNFSEVDLNETEN